VNDILVGPDARVYVGNFGYDLFDEEPRRLSSMRDPALGLGGPDSSSGSREISRRRRCRR
jgi:hypothetical protein